MKNIKDPKTIENHYHHIIDMINDAIVIYDMEGEITNINDNFSEMIGLSRDKIIGSNITDFIDNKNKPIFPKDTYKRDDKNKQYECVFITAEGNRIDTSLSLTPFYDKGFYQGSLAVITNITGLKQAEEALKKQKQALEAKTMKIEELSTTVKVLIENRDENKRITEEQVLSNIRRLVEPYLEKLKVKNDFNEKQKIYLSILESNIKDITSQLSHKLSLDYSHLTKSELQIADLIKHGKSSKEIADILCISVRTVDTHRNRIRKKLGIIDRNDNLRSYLLSFQ